MTERFDHIPDPPKGRAPSDWSPLSLPALVFALVAFVLLVALVVMIVTGSLSAGE